MHGNIDSSEAMEAGKKFIGLRDRPPSLISSSNSAVDMSSRHHRIQPAVYVLFELVLVGLLLVSTRGASFMGEAENQSRRASRVSDWEPCFQSSQGLALSTNSSVLQFANMTATLFPIDRQGNVMRDDYVSLQFLGLQEMSGTELQSPAQGQCYIASVPLASSSSSFELHSTAMGDQMECMSSVVEDFLPGGIPTKTIMTRTRHPIHTQLQLILNVTQSFGDFEQVIPGSNYTNYIPLNISHKYALPWRNTFRTRIMTLSTSYKLAIEMKHWNWTGPVEDSYLVAFIKAQFQTHETGRVTFSVTPSMMPALIETSSVIFDERIDRGFTLDGTPYFNFQKAQNETQYTLPAFYPLTIPLALGLCYQQPLGYHFDHWFWDPQLAVLLAPMPDQTPPPPARKSMNRIAIAAGVTVAVVIIGSIAIAVGYTLYKKHLWNNRQTTK